MDVVESFMSANIPLGKLDNPKLREFFQNSVKGGGSLPNANTLRQIYVEKVYNNNNIHHSFATAAALCLST